MKYLITHDTTIINLTDAKEWGIDKVVTYDSLRMDLSSLPSADEHIIYFIPTILDSNNPLNYDGAKLALRILMNYIRSLNTCIDIVLLGIESERDFLLTYDYPNIMKIPGFYYAQFNKKVVSEYTAREREIFRPEEYLPFLENLNLKLPSSFKSTHSLTNEWCLYKWSSFMGFKTNTELLAGLYFDYLITIERLKRVNNKTASEYLKQKIKSLPSGFHILIIDDNPGWHLFFEEMFADCSAVDFRCIGSNFKKLKYEDIERQIRNEIELFQPDVIILDFRLMEDKDAEVKNNMKKISGYKILSEVLKGNYKNPCDSFGRQVLIFTATSRIENILLLKEGNADGFILKERPESYKGKEISKDLISQMISDIRKGLERAEYLIPLNRAISKFENLIAEFVNINPTLNVKIETVGQSVRQLTQNNDISIDVLKIGFLNIFSILESLKDVRSAKLNTFINTEASRLGLDSDNFSLWDDIDEIRNCLAHGDNIIKKGKFKGQTISIGILKESTINLCEFILKFLQLYLKKQIDE